MRHIKHFKEDPDKILHIETEGCKVNVIIGTHDQTGTIFTTVEILPEQPDGDGRNWLVIGPGAVIVVPAAAPGEAESWLFRDIQQTQQQIQADSSGTTAPIITSSSSTSTAASA